MKSKNNEWLTTKINILFVESSLSQTNQSKTHPKTKKPPINRELIVDPQGLGPIIPTRKSIISQDSMERLYLKVILMIWEEEIEEKD